MERECCRCGCFTSRYHKNPNDWTGRSYICDDCYNAQADRQAGCLFAIITMPFKGWFWKYVVPMLVLPLAGCFVWGICSLMDGDAHKYVWGNVNKVKTEINTLIEAKNYDAAGKTICIAQNKGYHRFLRERDEVDQKIFVTRFVPARPDLLVSGYVRSRDGVDVIMESQADEGNVSIRVSFKSLSTELKKGDFVTVRGKARRLNKYDYKLIEAEIDNVGFEHFWE